MDWNLGNREWALVQERFQRGEIREAQSGVLDAALGDVPQGVVAPHHDQPEARRVDWSLPAHDWVARNGSAGEAFVIARSSENAPRAADDEERRHGEHQQVIFESSPF